jgi:cell wall-associated NlpC family hydrolase
LQAEWLPTICPLLLLVSLLPTTALAQATTEAAATTGSASVVAGSKRPAAAPGNRTQPKASAHLPASSGPPAEETNRKNFEDHAGPDAGKLMMHSVPTGAQIFVNGFYVGRAPLLLLLAPAKYNLEMRGERQEIGQRTISLLPAETQEIVVTLASKYPGKVTIR